MVCEGMHIRARAHSMASTAGLASLTRLQPQAFEAGRGLG